MFSAAAIDAPTPSRTHLRLAMLDQWAEIGLALAEKVVAEAGRGLGHGIRTFLRICQAVRLAVALAARLSDPTNPAFQPAPARSPAPPPAAPEASAESETSDGETPPEKPARTGSDQSWLNRVLNADAAILRRPVAEIVKVICDALGVVPDWSLWAEDAEAAASPKPILPHLIPPPDPGRALPEPRPRPPMVLHPAPRPRPLARLLTRLRSSCAPGALETALSPVAALSPVTALSPIALQASGRVRLARG